MEERTLAFRISADLQKRIKIRIAEKGMTLKDYIIELVENDLEQPVYTIQELDRYMKRIDEYSQELDDVSKLVKSILEKQKAEDNEKE